MENIEQLDKSLYWKYAREKQLDQWNCDFLFCLLSNFDVTNYNLVMSIVWRDWL